MKAKWQWLERGGIVLLFLTLISLAITLTINAQWLYRWDIEQLDILSYTTLSQEKLL